MFINVYTFMLLSTSTLTQLRMRKNPYLRKKGSQNCQRLAKTCSSYLKKNYLTTEVNQDDKQVGTRPGWRPAKFPKTRFCKDTKDIIIFLPHILQSEKGGKYFGA